MNKYNIEVGDLLGDDKVTLVDNNGISFSTNPTHSTIYNWSYLDNHVNKPIYGDWKLTKMNKKIIGYTLLKDTPDTAKGSILTLEKGDTGYYETPDLDEGFTLFLKARVESNTEWFSPIYEEVKPTEVYVDTLAGKVKVTKNWVSIESGEDMTINQTLELIKITSKAFSNITMRGYDLKLETFKVGCKTFHISDIPKIEEAIKQVS